MDPGSARLQLFFGLVFVVLAADVVVGALWFGDHFGRGGFVRFKRWFARVSLGVTAVGVACFLYAWLIESRWVEVTTEEVQTTKLPAGSRFRIVQLSDFHAVSMSWVLEELPERVNALQPDLIVFTGDTVNAERGLPMAKQVFGRLHATYGRLAVRGNHDVWYWSQLDLFGGVATELNGAPLEIGPLSVCGAPYGVTGKLPECVAANPHLFRVVAYHTPDLIEDLAPSGVDLYLAGHTHGGQVRVPLYGALITYSRFDKKYEMGRYQIGSTTLYVNRGIGFEPGMPDIRFLCRPEIAVIDLVGVQATH